jgi:hypothetical protein
MASLARKSLSNGSDRSGRLGLILLRGACGNGMFLPLASFAQWIEAIRIAQHLAIDRAWVIENVSHFFLLGS